MKIIGDRCFTCSLHIRRISQQIEQDQMHTLSILTWWIHLSSVIEWTLSIFIIARLSKIQDAPEWQYLAFSMLPALASAMSACTWHLFDNPLALQGLVVFQAGATLIGNSLMSLAARYIWETRKC
ncbi:hypothetical protein PMYN1_Chma126 (chromatophore) [Paulinella micropora]|uniref:Ycf49-like protein n=1 Tax=Paulinella micropora TaxID=1928728 RepID=A0A1L5YB77_9EUKA|nr:hypothetical protein PCKR_163 [Paulinella micropora]AQX44726.1 hypothetical protein PFK_163 [Paulinella micropora]BBL85938.1 hypothetical protein PMYN1_Chma126 [Paulinella micropora]